MVGSIPETTQGGLVMGRNALLATVAATALLAGASLTSAQAPSGDRSPGASEQRQMSPGAQGQQRQEGQQGQQRQQEGQPGQTQQRQREQGQTTQQPTQQRDQGQTTTQQRDQGQTGTQQRQQGQTTQITSEQRTRISSIVKTHREARVSNVNFDIRVGTVVPRTVKLVALPQEVVVIHPAWRGFLFFIVEEQIVIVEPGSLRIV